MNLLEEVEGTRRAIKTACRYLALPAEEKLLFRPGRRGGVLRSLDELNDPVMRQRLQLAMRHLESEAGGDVEKILTELGDQYIQGACPW